MSTEFYEEYVEKNKAIIYRICKAYANNDEEFQDYFQEVCLQLWKSRNKFNHQSKLSTWIYRVTLNVCLTLVRNEKKKGENTPILDHHLVSNPNEQNEEKEQLEVLYSAIKNLREIDKGIILLYLEKKSYQEIADITGISVSNVGVKVNRIKNQLKEEINEKY